jgi:hypothetical protein
VGKKRKKSKQEDIRDTTIASNEKEKSKEREREREREREKERGNDFVFRSSAWAPFSLLFYRNPWRQKHPTQCPLSSTSNRDQIFLGKLLLIIFMFIDLTSFIRNIQK